MEHEMKVEPLLQWHPAFFAGIRIEFSEEESKVQFESKHQLGTKPMLEKVRGFQIEAHESGIYYIKGDVFPIQLIVTSRLCKEQNFWLKNLTDDLKSREAVEELARGYHEHRENTLCRSVMTKLAIHFFIIVLENPLCYN